MKVFISHSFDDASKFDNVCYAFESADLPYWNPKEMPAGTPLRDKLREAIKECPVCVLIASDNSLNSGWCQAEIGAFWGAGKPVIMYSPDELEEDDIPKQLRGDLWASTARELVKSVKFHLSNTAPKELNEPQSIDDIGELKKLVVQLQESLESRMSNQESVSPERKDSPDVNSRGATEAEGVISPDRFDRGYRNVTWYLKGLERARGVAGISDVMGNICGTGFVIPGTTLHKSFGEQAVLVTAAHVVSPESEQVLQPPALAQSEARVTFHVLDGGEEEYKLEELLWWSPRTELDTAIYKVDRPVEGVESYMIPKRPPLADGRQRVYIIGHPRGGKLSFSLYDNAILDYEGAKIHYRAATEGGSAGSPVFNAQFDLIAVHHKGSRDMPKLNGKPGTYEAREGVLIRSIVEAIEADLSEAE